jgi:hypothetical protein
MPQKHTKTLVVVPFQPPLPELCQHLPSWVSFHLLDVETRQAPNGSMQGGLHITPAKENTGVICCDSTEHYKTKQSAELTLLNYAHVI